MSPAFWTFVLAALLVWMGATAVYHFVMAALGRLFGIEVRRISIGIGPTLIGRTVGRCELRIAVLPLGGSTTFKGQENEDNRDIFQGNDGRFDQAAPWAQVLIALAGPLSNLVIAGVLLGLPVWAGRDQLAATSADRTLIHPCAVGGLTLRPEPSTWEGQGKLVRETAGEFMIRLATFRSLEGWGGYVGFFVTAGAAAEVSRWAWVSCLGAFLAGMGFFNLLPIPGLNGFMALDVVRRAVIGRGLSERPRTLVFCLGLLALFLILGRIEWIDVRWLFHTLFP